MSYYYDEDEEMTPRQKKIEAIFDEMRLRAPKMCRNCDHLVIGAEDNRFDHEFGTGGEIEYFPKCDVTNEEVFDIDIEDEECEIRQKEGRYERAS